MQHTLYMSLFAFLAAFLASCVVAGLVLCVGEVFTNVKDGEE